MTSRKYKVRSTEELAEAFKKKAAIFNRNLRALEDKAKRCESLKWVSTQTPGTVLSKGDDDKYLLDWQPYLNDGKRKLSRTLAKLKEIQNHRKQRPTSFIDSVKEVLPSWTKKKGRGKSIQLTQLINDTEDCQALITDVVQQINSAEELSNMVNKISQERDSNLNDELFKELEQLTSRWNSLNLTVINRSNSLESLGLEVDHEYKNLNEWYRSCDTFRHWLDSSENVLNVESSEPEATIPAINEKLKTIQVQITESQNRKFQLQKLNSETEVLLDSGRLDKGDAERVEKINDSLSSRYVTIKEKLAETQNNLKGNLQQLKKKPEKKIETPITEILIKPNHKPPPKIISSFHKEKEEANNNESQVNDSMNSVKKMLERAGRRTYTETEKDRVHDESLKAFNSSLDTCEKALTELDEESLQNFSFVGSTINKVKEQLDDIQVLEEHMTKEDKNFSLVKETFDESEKKPLIKEESRGRLQRRIDDLNSRWEEMWRAHETNKDRLVQAILIMGGEWMGSVNYRLSELEDSMKSNEISEDDLRALRDEEQRHKEIMNNIISHEDSVSGAVDVAREVHRRDLVTEETGKTIENETRALEDRLERLKSKAEDKKKRISTALRKAEEANTVNETMVASTVVAVHSAPNDSPSDEGFFEPKRGLFKKKETYESIMKKKMKEFNQESKSMNEWMDETEKLVSSLSVGMESHKATKIQQKINMQYAQVQEKQSKVDRIVQLSKQISNETLDPTISEPFVQEADAVRERWSKDKEMIENYGENDAGSKAATGNCCFIFLKKRLFPAWSYN